MRLVLSSSAAPRESLRSLLEACTRKGLDGLELVEGDGHGVAPSRCRATEVARATLESEGISLSAFRVRRSALLETDGMRRLAAALKAPVVVPLVSRADLDVVARSAEWYAAEAGGLCVGSPDAGALLRASARPEPFDLGWDVIPGHTDPSDMDSALSDLGGRLSRIRLFGGGPEAHAQAGTGIGSLMSRLAGIGFMGDVALTPSDPRYHVAWSAWLGRRRGWGCGGGTAGEPVTLGVSEEAS